MSSRILARVLVVLGLTLCSLFFELSAQTRMTAQFLRSTADSLSLVHAADAELALVTCSSMDTTGKSDNWSYVYFSFDSSKEYHFHAWNSTVTFDSSCGIRIGIGILTVRWIDSDSALAIAERSGGLSIRKSFPPCTIAASLLNPMSYPLLNCWRIGYECSDSTRTIVVNAAGIPVSVKEINRLTIPKEFGLYQNYPNPFNPSTTISFDLPFSSFVTLRVFDLLGNDVATIVSKDFSKGIYSFRWDATGLTSGVYYCRLQVGSRLVTKKLMLLK